MDSFQSEVESAANHTALLCKALDQGPSPCVSKACSSQAIGTAAGEEAATTEATPGPALSGHVLKVTHGHDTRRLKVCWPSCALAGEVLPSIRAAIEEGFGLRGTSEGPPGFFLKYRDDEGDLCTLVEETLADFLEMALHGNSFKLILEMAEQVTKPQSFQE